MSSQLDGHLELPSSYNFNKESMHQYRRNTINPNNFHLWVKKDMYGSTYAKHHSPDSLEPRSSHIPGYSGFIPKNRAESLHASTYSNMTKSVLADPNINANRTGLATTGFNIAQDSLIDKSKMATSHKYGKSQLQTPHPGWIPNEMTSTTKDAYRPPKDQIDPTFRETDKRLQTTKMKNQTSGYQQNRAYWDGKGWNPHPVLHPTVLSSEYRDRFNPERSFHRKVDQHIKPQLQAPESKYSFNV